jgi:hypothetical protein
MLENVYLLKKIRNTSINKLIENLFFLYFLKFKTETLIIFY